MPCIDDKGGPRPDSTRSRGRPCDPNAHDHAERFGPDSTHGATPGARLVTRGSTTPRPDQVPLSPVVETTTNSSERSTTTPIPRSMVSTLACARRPTRGSFGEQHADIPGGYDTGVADAEPDPRPRPIPTFRPRSTRQIRHACRHRAKVYVAGVGWLDGDSGADRRQLRIHA